MMMGTCVSFDNVGKTFFLLGKNNDLKEKNRKMLKRSRRRQCLVATVLYCWWVSDVALRSVWPAVSERTCDAIYHHGDRSRTPNKKRILF